MKEFKMRMHNIHFQKIKNKVKTIEVRLNDKKRSSIKTGDKIIFINRKDSENIVAKVIAVYRSESFDELMKMFNVLKTGYETKKEIKLALKEFYSKEQECEFGVVGIEIEIV